MIRTPNKPERVERLKANKDATGKITDTDTSDAENSIPGIAIGNKNSAKMKWKVVEISNCIHNGLEKHYSRIRALPILICKLVKVSELQTWILYQSEQPAKFLQAQWTQNPVTLDVSFF